MMLSHLTDEDLVVVLMSELTEAVGHVGDPVPQVVHPVFTADADTKTGEVKMKENNKKTFY